MCFFMPALYFQMPVLCKEKSVKFLWHLMFGYKLLKFQMIIQINLVKNEEKNKHAINCAIKKN